MAGGKSDATCGKAGERLRVTESRVIDFADLLVVLDGWGPCKAACPADLDEDGLVGIDDLLVVLASWGPC